MFRNRNLAELILSAAAGAPEALFGTDSTSTCLPDAVQRARGLAEKLQRAGLRRGATVAFVGVTSEQYLLTWLAAQLVGIRTALINPHYPQELIQDMLGDLAPNAVAYFEDGFSVDAFHRWRLLDARGAWNGKIEISQPESADEPRVPTLETPGKECDGAEIACYMHTSGTSGRPKFCALSHHYFIRLGRFIADSLGYVRGDVIYAPMPMFHINPMGYGVVAALTAGASVLGTRRFTAHDFWSTVKRIGATTAVLHATPLKMLLKHTSAADSAGHRLRSVFFATTEFLDRFKVPVGATVYGSTEAGGLCHLWHVRAGDTEPAEEGTTHYAGRPRFDVEAAISADGEILVRERVPHTLFSGYLRDGRLDRSVDVDGWFHTGDRGRLDRFGNLVFIERASESIRVNGEYVPIDYVERKLEEAGLTEFAIWSRPDDVAGQRVVLWVTDPELDLERTTAMIGSLPKIMRPVEIIRIAQLPRDTGVNKVQRRRLSTEPVLWRHAVQAG